MNTQSTSFYNIYRASAGAFIFLSLAIPAASILNIPLKHLISLITAILLIPVIATSKIRTKDIVFFSCGFIALSFWSLLGLYNGYPNKSVIAESAGAATIILAFFFTSIIAKKEGSLSASKYILRSALAGSICFLCIKTIFFIATLANPALFLVISDALHYKPVGLAIATGGSRLSIIQSDFSSMCIILTAYLFRREADLSSRLIWAIAFPLLLLSLYSAYSRSLFAIFSLLSIACFIYYEKSRNSRIASTCAITILALSTVLIFISEIQEVIEQRFLNQEHSDSWRELMITGLLDHWLGSFVFGWGLGAHAPGLIRTEDAPYTYEVQLLAIFMKMGIFSVLILLFTTAKFFWVSISSYNRPCFFLFLIFFLLLANSMTNQYLLSTTSSALMAVIWHSRSLCSPRKILNTPAAAKNECNT